MLYSQEYMKQNLNIIRISIFLTEATNKQTFYYIILPYFFHNIITRCTGIIPNTSPVLLLRILVFIHHPYATKCKKSSHQEDSQSSIERNYRPNSSTASKQNANIKMTIRRRIQKLNGSCLSIQYFHNYIYDTDNM